MIGYHVGLGRVEGCIGRNRIRASRVHIRLGPRTEGSYREPGFMMADKNWGRKEQARKIQVIA